MIMISVIFAQIFFITLKLKNRMSIWFRNIIEKEMKKKNSGYAIAVKL